MSCAVKLFLLLFGVDYFGIYSELINSPWNPSDGNVLRDLLRSSKYNKPFNAGSLALGSTQNQNVKGNEAMKRFRISPSFEDKIYQQNYPFARRSFPNSRLKRSVGTAGALVPIPGRQGRLDMGISGMLPQNLLLMQQQEVMAAALLQQQMLSIQNRYGYNTLAAQRQRPYRYDYDDDDSESDEDDEFDSEEFMSYPIRMGFMPPMPGFPGKK